MGEFGICILACYENGLNFVHKMLAEMINDTLLLEKSRLSPIARNVKADARIYEIPLNTKYYSTKIHLWTFNDFAALSNWKRRSDSINQKTSALVVQVEILSANQKFLTQFKTIVQQCNASSGVVLVNGDVSKFQTNYNRLQCFCIDKGFELIEMQPNEETKQMLFEYNESYGLQRLFEIFSTVDWPNRSIIMQQTELPEYRRQIDEIIDDLDKPGGLESIIQKLTSLANNRVFFDFPNAEDEGNILTHFGHILDDPTVFPSMESEAQKKNKKKSKSSSHKPTPSPETFQQSSESTPRKVIVDSFSSSLNESQEIEVDILSIDDDNSFLAKNTNPTDFFNNVSAINTTNRNDCLKNDFPALRATQDDIISNCFIAEDGSKTNVKIVDILENILRENGRLPFLQNLDSDVTNKCDNFSSMIGQLNEIKQKSMVLGREERVSLASKVSLSVLENLIIDKSSSPSIDSEDDFREFNVEPNSLNSEQNEELSKFKIDDIVVQHIKAE